MQNDYNRTVKKSDTPSIKETVLNNRFKKKHITPSMVDKANQVNVQKLLCFWDKDSIEYSNGQLVLASNKHVVVYNDMVYNHYNGVATNALNTLMEYFDLSFPQAYYVCEYCRTKVTNEEIATYLQKLKKQHLLEHDTLIEDTAFSKIIYNKETDILLSENTTTKADALKRAYAYLCNTRKIERDIVSHFIKRGYLGMDINNNLCFYTRDNDNNVVAITKKGTNPFVPFKQNYVKESHTGFFYGSKLIDDYDEVFVFESVIDLMSYLSLIRRGDIQHPDRACYISTNGVSRKYLIKILEKYQSIKTVHFCYDNDIVGYQNAGEFIYKERQQLFGDRLTADTLIHPLMEYQVKDWNDYLKEMDKPF